MKPLAFGVVLSGFVGDGGIEVGLCYEVGSEPINIT